MLWNYSTILIFAPFSYESELKSSRQETSQPQPSSSPSSHTNPTWATADSDRDDPQDYPIPDREDSLPPYQRPRPHTQPPPAGPTPDLFTDDESPGPSSGGPYIGLHPAQPRAPNGRQEVLQVHTHHPSPIRSGSIRCPSPSHLTGHRNSILSFQSLFFLH